MRAPTARKNRESVEPSEEEIGRTRSGHAGLRRTVLLAVDPDTKGAIAVATWSSSHLASMPGGENDALEVVDWQTIEFRVFDMPCASVQLMKKSKVTGKPATRRIIDIQAARKLIMQEWSPVSFDSSIPRLLAFVEAPPIIPTDSALSTSTMSYTNGVWHGLFAMGGFQTGSVPARVWKRDLDLWKKDKSASRLLASQVFPNMQSLFSLKKNHGRAEALLIAAWALGLRIDKESPLSTNGFVFGPLRACHQTDAYGNDVLYNTTGHISSSNGRSSSVTSSGQTFQQHELVYADVETLQQLRLEEKEERHQEKARVAVMQKEARKLRKMEISKGRKEDLQII